MGFETLQPRLVIVTGDDFHDAQQVACWSDVDGYMNGLKMDVEFLTVRVVNSRGKTLAIKPKGERDFHTLGSTGR